METQVLTSNGTVQSGNVSLSDPDALTGEEQKSIVAILIEKFQEKKQMTVQVSDAE